MKQYDVIALGELLIDFAPYSTNEAGYPILSANPGGAPGNFLAALARYGCKTAMIGKVGDDSFGKALTPSDGLESPIGAPQERTTYHKFEIRTFIDKK
jgi:bifunctional ADP-heptose synthase (sugar kinase/adenylyltransferase)